MTELSREAQVMRTFGTLADTLVVGYDVVDLLQTLVDTCKDLLNTTAAGILLADDLGYLEVVASTSEANSLVELLQLGAEVGPSASSYATGQLLEADNLTAPGDWPEFRRDAVRHGFLSVTVFPLRLRDTTIGTLTIFGDSAEAMSESDQLAARAFADVATIGILHERTLRESTAIREQLQHALGSRIVIEQAKGMVAHLKGITVDEAFELIRSYARSHRLGIGAVASRVVDRSLTL